MDEIDPVMKRWPTILFQAVTVLALTELILRLTGIFSFYSERIGNGTVSYYGQQKRSWFHSWTPSHPYSLDQPEFSFSYQANSLGLRGDEWTIAPPENHCRVIVLGDSFVEGDGTPAGMEYPAQLESALVQRDLRWQVYNAGVCGSDPFFNAMFFTHVLPNYDYDAVMFLVNHSDFDDFIFRGGMERFREDSTTVFRQGPWWLRPYLASHLFRGLARIFTGVDPELLVGPEEREALNRLAASQMADLFGQIHRECDRYGKEMAVILHPVPTELRHPDTRNGMDSLSRSLEQAGIPVIDLFSAMADSTSGLPYVEYAWPINGHFNTTGYRIMANATLASVKKGLPGFFSDRCRSAENGGTTE
jgi:hypothetical protein